MEQLQPEGFGIYVPNQEQVESFKVSVLSAYMNVIHIIESTPGVNHKRRLRDGYLLTEPPIDNTLITLATFPFFPGLNILGVNKRLNSKQEDMFALNTRINFLEESNKMIIIPTIDDIYVSPKFRGQGIGKKIVQVWEQEFQNIDDMYTIFGLNLVSKEAFTFWQMLGYKPEPIEVYGNTIVSWSKGM